MSAQLKEKLISAAEDIKKHQKYIKIANHLKLPINGLERYTEEKSQLSIQAISSIDNYMPLKPEKICWRQKIFCTLRPKSKYRPIWHGTNTSHGKHN